MRRTMIIGIGALAMATSCSSTPERFRPVERATATSPSGYPAAEYPIRTEQGDLGDVKVWSQGAYRGDDGRTRLYVGFEIDNATEHQLTLETSDLYVDSATVNRQMLRDVPVSSLRGSAVVPPGSTRQLTATFVMPAGIRPQNLDAFRVRWRISDGDVSYSQRTPFLESPSTTGAYVTYYHTPFFDPFYYDSLFYPRRIIVYRVPFRHRTIHRVRRARR